MHRHLTGLALVLLGTAALLGCEEKAEKPATSTAAPKATAKPTATATAKANTMAAEDMAKEAHKTGRAVVPEGWKPKPNDKVVKELGTTGLFDMYTVTRLLETKAFVKFCGTGDEMKSPVGADALAPVPDKAAKDLPEAGKFIIIPEKGADSCKWQFAKVKKVDGGNVIVETVNFQKSKEKTEIQERMVRAGEFVLVK